MKPNCKVGDLAITVKCHVPDNLGKIVQIIAHEGLQKWVDKRANNFHCANPRM
jgi:hypothetical protein